MKDFIFTLLAWLLTLPFIVGAVAFAIYNQQISPVTLNPFRDAYAMPLYVPVLGAIAFGFLFGAVMTWAGMGSLRKQKRDQAKRIKLLERQIHTANQNHVTPHNYSLIPSSFTEKR